LSPNRGEYGERLQNHRPFNIATFGKSNQSRSLRGFDAAVSLAPLAPFGRRDARTLEGNSKSDWKYIPVRRLALFIEESIDRGIQWAVFEPNAELLWT
jgi:hypothetical protein